MIPKVKLMLTVFVIVGLLFTAYAQETISPDQSAKFMRQNKTVCGQVVGSHFAAKSDRQPTFLNLDKPHPAQVFTIVIFGEDRGKFEKPPEELYRDRDVCVSGLIVEHKGKAQMVVRNPSQMRVKWRP